MSCRPHDLKIFLETLPSEGQPPYSGAPRGRRAKWANSEGHFLFAEGTAQPLKEILVGASVMAVTAALGFWVIMAEAV